MEQNLKNTRDVCEQIFTECRSQTVSKNDEYGASWRLYRKLSFLNKLKIKALRIRNLQNGVHQMVGDESISGNFYELVNYSVIAQIQLDLPETTSETIIDTLLLESKHLETSNSILTLLDQKNNDYGEAWRELDEEFFVDEILVKLERGRKIAKSRSKKNKEKIISGLKEVYCDICNYAMFAIILLREEEQRNKTNQDKNEN